MFRKKNKDPDKDPPNSKSPPAEYSKRVSRLLLVCVVGLQKLIVEQEAFYSELANLGEVIKKVIRPTPNTGLSKEIEDFFERWVLEHKFRETKNEAIRQIIQGLTETVQHMLSSSTEFDQHLGKCIEEIEAAEAEEDILQLKDQIIKEIQKAREDSSSLITELEGYRKTTQSLAKKLERTEAKALVDPLTNVLNRNAYNLKIGQMIRSFEQFGSVFAIMVIDIDHFKNFNDQYGHRAGDRVLNSAAGTLKETLRSTDLLFRYGGEEFVVLLSEVNLENAKKIAEKLRSEIEKDYFVDQKKQLKVTVSIGVTCAKEADTEETLFERADKAMYLAKKDGRNRVAVIE